METWRAIGHGLVGGGAGGILLWAVLFFVSMGETSVHAAPVLLAAGLAFLGGLAMTVAADMMLFEG